MALISRSVKANTGTTSFGATGNVVSDLEFDITALTNGMNGALDDTNFAAGAAVELSKLDGYSDSDTEQDTETSPGTLDGGRVAAATLQTEITQLRYAVARLSGYVNAEREAGAGLVGVPWLEPPFLGENIVRNASFGTVDISTGCPLFFAEVGAATTHTITDAATALGMGLQWRVGAGVADGVSCTLGELRASTKYLIVVRAGLALGDAEITTVGADGLSVYQDVTKTMVGAAQANYAFVVKTDATPTNIVLSILGAGGAGGTVDITHVGAYELSSEPLGQAAIHSFAVDSSAAQALAVVAGEVNCTAVGVMVPPGHMVRINADGNGSADVGNGVITLRIKDNGGTLVGADQVLRFQNTTDIFAFSLSRLDTSPVVAGMNTYTLTGQATVQDGALENMSMTVEVIPLR